MRKHVHAEAIKSWADGHEMEWSRNGGPWNKLEEPVHWPNEGEGFEFRIKPAEPERVYPMTQLSSTEICYEYDAGGHPGEKTFEELRRVINFAFRKACDAGQIVTREEFDRAVGDRKARDMAIAQAVSDRVMASFTSHAKLPISVKEFSEIIESVK